MSNNYNYSAVRATSNVDGSLIQLVLDVISAASATHDFGKQAAFSQDGLAIMIDCRCADDFSHLIEIDPKIAEFIFDEDDIPAYLSVGCENMDQSTAQIIVGTTGEYGEAWSAPPGRTVGDTWWQGACGRIAAGCGGA